MRAISVFDDIGSHGLDCDDRSTNFLGQKGTVANKWVFGLNWGRKSPDFPLACLVIANSFLSLELPPSINVNTLMGYDFPNRQH